MKNIINYFYGINIMDYCENDDKYIFYMNNMKYIFLPFDRDKNEIRNVYNIYQELKKRNILTNEIVPNKFDNLITEYNGQSYVLIKKYEFRNKIDINDIIYIQNNTMNIFKDMSLIRTNYINLWERKIDYYENNSELRKHNLINKSMDYYIGLGENAIIYLVNNNVRINNIVLSHRRISEDKGSFEFYNPVNYILDSRARDLADYIKILFFYDDVQEDVILSILKIINFDREECILFIARMLYPTYYFDVIDKIMVSNIDDSILNNIIKKTNSYIKLIAIIFNYFNNYLNMNVPIIEWIIKT